VRRENPDIMHRPWVRIINEGGKAAPLKNRRYPGSESGEARSPERLVLEAYVYFKCGWFNATGRHNSIAVRLASAIARGSSSENSLSTSTVRPSFGPPALTFLRHTLTAAEDDEDDEGDEGDERGVRLDIEEDEDVNEVRGERERARFSLRENSPGLDVMTTSGMERLRFSAGLLGVTGVGGGGNRRMTLRRGL